ncbi:hypothetical protein BXZ70DRAFT_897055, partial [Cristinia sonorae]
DRYRQLLTAAREWQMLMAAKRHGLASLEDLEYGSLTVSCPACPQIGVNMEPGWQDLAKRDMYLAAIAIALDGNFRSNQKIKPMDPNDFPLSGPAAYFVDKDLYSDVMKGEGPLAPENTTCHKFGAMGFGYKWGKVAGVMGVFCARHMFALPGGLVDLERGERFTNVDLCVLSGLQRWLDLNLVIAGYDIACQYRIHYRTRMTALLDKLNDKKNRTKIRQKQIPQTIFGVGKFHAPAHTGECRSKHSFNYLPGVAMTDMEASERIWAIQNDLAKSTREMSSGHRHDVINLFHSDQNITKTHTLPAHLSRRLTLADAQHRSKLRVFNLLEEGVKTHVEDGATKLEEWREEERKWLEDVVNVKTHGNLKKVFSLKVGGGE